MRVGFAMILATLLAVTASASAIGTREAFECGPVVYTFGDEKSDLLVLLRWDPASRRFEDVQLPDGRIAPVAQAIVRKDDRSLAFVGGSGEGRWALWTLTFDPAGRLIEVTRGPDWPLADSITGLHRIKGGFVVVGADSVAILDDGGVLLCGWFLREIRQETFTSDGRHGLLI